MTPLPSPVTSAPATTRGIVVLALGADHSCLSVVGTSVAGVRVGTGSAAGLLMVARASLVHQISAAATATATAIAAAAIRSPRVRRSGGGPERSDRGVF